MAKWHVSRSPTDPELWAVFSDAGYLVADNLPLEDASQIAASPTLLEAAIAVSAAAVKRAAWGRDNVAAMREEQNALATIRAAITLATGKDA